MLRYVCHFLHLGQELNGYATKPAHRTLSNAETKARGPPTEPRGNVSCQTSRLQTDRNLPFVPVSRAYIDLSLFRLMTPRSTPQISAQSRQTLLNVLRMNRGALVAWMTGGSREDWAARVGELNVPTVVMAGTAEDALNPEAQQTCTLPHYQNATLLELELAFVEPRKVVALSFPCLIIPI